MKAIGKIKTILKHTIRNYNILYADSTEMLDLAQKLVRPLPQGCELVKLTNENKNFYKYAILDFPDVDLNKMLQVEGEVWVVVTNHNEIIAYHFGTYRGKKSLFFRVFTGMT